MLGGHHLRRRLGSAVSGTLWRREAGDARIANGDGLVGVLQRPLRELQEMQRQGQLVVRLRNAPVIRLHRITVFQI